MFHGRWYPYTEAGISRIPCIHCGEPSRQQWQVCANANQYVGVCNKCDLELNRIMLDFMDIPNREELFQRYKDGFISGSSN